ncbi:MAG: tagatose 1,6-diphosphate aldolase GatY/KbaY [Solirubrobacteraceae bacterium]
MLIRGVHPLHDARREGRAVAAFSVYNLEQTLGVCRAAEEADVPVLLQAGSSAFRYAGTETLAALALAAAEASPAAIGVHLDHAVDDEEIDRCLQAGYTSVMFDGSGLPLAENIRRTRAVARRAHEHGAWVEAELGGSFGDEDRTVNAARAEMTDPQQAQRFVSETGIDALAVAIGNVHGIPATPVALDFERLARIRARLDVPLVLHGASGLSDEDVQRAVAAGVAKINVNTELRRAFRAALAEVALAPPPGDALIDYLEPAIDAVRSAAGAKLRAFGATGEKRASHVG